MDTELTESNIHIVYEKSWYEGDLSLDCTITFSSPDAEQKVTINYQADTEVSIQERIFEDIAEYMKSPTEWTKAYLRNGADNEQKLRVLEGEAEEYRRSINRNRSYIAREEGCLKQKEEQIARLKLEMQKNPNELEE